MKNKFSLLFYSYFVSLLIGCGGSEKSSLTDEMHELSLEMKETMEEYTEKIKNTKGPVDFLNGSLEVMDEYAKAWKPLRNEGRKIFQAYKSSEEEFDKDGYKAFMAQYQRCNLLDKTFLDMQNQWMEKAFDNPSDRAADSREKREKLWAFDK